MIRKILTLAGVLFFMFSIVGFCISIMLPSPWGGVVGVASGVCFLLAGGFTNWIDYRYDNPGKRVGFWKFVTKIWGSREYENSHKGPYLKI